MRAGEPAGQEAQSQGQPERRRTDREHRDSSLPGFVGGQ